MNRQQVFRARKHIKRALLILLASSAAILSTFAFSGQMVGNGGDPIRLRFWKAKEFASKIVLKAQRQAFSKTTKKQTVDWILKNQEQLASDITGTEHVWHPDEATTCALTQLESKSPLYFFYPTCKKMNPSSKEMAALLIHESVHHLGIADEDFADDVAISLIRAWENGQLNWYPMPNPENTLSARMGHSMIWTGEKAIVFGGENEVSEFLNSGAIYDPKLQTWKSISMKGAPKRTDHQAIAFGSQMIIWGGYEKFEEDTLAWVANGFLYDLESDKWISIGSPIELEKQILRHWSSQVAIKLGRKLFVWGGEEAQDSDVLGGIYDLETQKWSQINLQNAPIRRQGHRAVAISDDRVLVWGGNKGRRNYTNEGAIYTLSSNSWKSISSFNAPDPRVDHSMIWTGKVAVVFGGDAGSGKLKGSGGIYNPKLDKWQTYESEVAFQRTGHLAVWTGDEMILFGGKVRRSGTFLGTPIAFNPDSLSFRVVTSKGGPGNSYKPAGVWATDVMLTIGGQDEKHDFKNTGGILFP